MSAAGPLVPPPPVRRRGYWAQTLRRFRREPLTLVACVVLLALFVTGALAPQLVPQGWNDLHLATRWQNHAPTLSGGNLFGTDNIGRSVLVRTLWGLHDSEQVALVGALLATILGVLAGTLAGLSGGWIDVLLMRAADVVTGFPVLVLMLVVFSLIHQVTVWDATLVFAFSLWTLVARVVRARIVALLPEEFVQAARALGASDRHIFFRHLLPNAAGAITVAATSLVGQIVLVEATAEFFGFGVASLIRPTLGNLIADATASGIGPYNDLGLGWWTWVGPGAMLVLTLLCVNLVGDGLDTALDPLSRPR